MATATWTPVPDGISLLTLRNQWNTFSAAIITDVEAIETTLTDVALKSDTGMLYATGGVLTPISLTTAYQKVKLIDATGIDLAAGHVTPDYVANTLTFNTTGIYKLAFTGSVTADNGSLLTFNYNVNTVSAIAVPPQFTGKGANPIAIGNHTVLSITAGDVLYIEAKADAATTLTPQSCGFMLEKTHF